MNLISYLRRLPFLLALPLRCFLADLRLTLRLEDFLAVRLRRRPPPNSTIFGVGGIPVVLVAIETAEGDEEGGRVEGGEEAAGTMAVAVLSAAELEGICGTSPVESRTGILLLLI